MSKSALRSVSTGHSSFGNSSSPPLHSADFKHSFQESLEDTYSPGCVAGVSEIRRSVRFVSIPEFRVFIAGTI